MDVHGEMGVATRVGRGLRRDPRHGAAQMGNENLTFRRGQIANACEHGFNRAVGQRIEIVTFPVIARAGREKRIKHRLPAHKTLAANDIGDGRAEPPERRRGLFTFFQVSP